MKTSIYILTTLFTLSFTPLMASNTSVLERPPVATELTPSVPLEATFDESVPEQDITLKLALKLLAPVTPEEAEFYEAAEEVTAPSTGLEPVAPETADFEDSI